MKKILVLTDLSDNSVNAYRYAVEMACQAQSDILLVFSSNGTPMPLTRHLDYSQRLHSFAKRYSCITRLKANPHHTESLLSSDPWVEALPLLIQVHRPDLVVAGSGLLEAFKSGRTDWPLQQIGDCPLLWVPEKAAFRGLQHLVFVTDFTDQDPAVVNQVKALAQVFSATVSPVHFYPPSDRSQLAVLKRLGADLHQLLNRESGQFHLVEEEDMQEGLQDFAEQQPVDLFLIATRDNHLAHQYLRTTYRKTLACQTQIPLLNLYQEKKKSCAGDCEFCHRPPGAQVIRPVKN